MIITVSFTVGLLIVVITNQFLYFGAFKKIDRFNTLNSLTLIIAPFKNWFVELKKNQGTVKQWSLLFHTKKKKKPICESPLCLSASVSTFPDLIE
jgi:hypothetical protein